MTADTETTKTWYRFIYEAPGPANLVRNGEFANSGIADRNTGVGPAGWLWSVPGWTTTGEGKDRAYLDPTAPDGSALAVDGSFSVYQDIPTEAGRNYVLTLSHKAKQRATHSLGPAIEVWWNGNKVATLDNTDWQQFTLQLEGASLGETTRLEFRGTNGDEWGYISYGNPIDDVKLQVASTPRVMRREISDTADNRFRR